MATNNTSVAVGSRREVPLQAPGTVVAAANTNQWDLYEIPSEVAGVVLVVNVTAAATGTTPSVVPTIYGRAGAANVTWSILAGAPITAVGTYVFKVHDSLTAAANLVANDVIGEYLRIEMAHGNAQSITYSVTAELIY